MPLLVALLRKAFAPARGRRAAATACGTVDHAAPGRAARARAQSGRAGGRERMGPVDRKFHPRAGED